MLSSTMRALQAFAGAPVTVTGSVTSTDPNTDLATDVFVFLGVTAAIGAPATYAGLAAHDNGGTNNDIYSTPLWDLVAYTQQLSSQGGVGGPNRVTFQVSKIERLGTFAAGQYLWLVTFAQAAYPAGGDAPDTVAGPYLLI